MKYSFTDTNMFNFKLGSNIQGACTDYEGKYAYGINISKQINLSKLNFLTFKGILIFQLMIIKSNLKN